MDDFATLARDFGFRPHGKSAPMTASGAKIGVETDAGDRVSSSAFLDKGNRDGFLFNNVIDHGPTKISTAHYTNSKSASTLSDLDYDSIFKNSSSTTAVGKAKNGSSSPVYDKPVYDEDIFDGLPGLKNKSTSFSVNFENVFASLSPPKSQHRSAGFNDLHENFDRTAKSDAQNQKSTAGLDDLLPGFGGTSSASSRPLSESNGMHSTANSTKPIPTAAEDPFVVIGSTSKSRVSSPDMFTNPHDVMGKIGHSGKTEVEDSFNGGVFESIDFLNGFGKSVPTFPSEMNTGYRMSTEHNSSDSEPIRRSQFNGPETHFQKKMPYDNFQDPYQTIFEVPGDSLDSHKFDAQTSSSYVYPNYDADATSTSVAHAEPSDEVWLSVSDFPIVTQLTRAPPPSRPPPPIPFRYAKEVRVKEYTKNSRTKEAVQLEKDEQIIHDDQERKYREMQEKLESEQRQSEEEEKKLRRLEEEKKQRRLEEEKEQRRLEEEKEQRRLEEEKEQRRLEKERERAREIAREREMGRQAVERATREARERAAIEARERAAAEVRQKAERTAVQRVQAEARERATVEARERAEKAVAEARERSNAEAREKEAREKETREKAEARERAAVARAEDEASERAAAEARQKAERNAVQRVQAEARERAGRAAVEARDRENAGAREKEIREKAAVARAEARQRAERAAVDRVAAEARERAAADARERAAADARERGAAKMGQQKNDNDLDAFFSAGRASSAPRPTTNSRANSTFQSKAAPEVARTSSVSASSNTRKTSSTTNIIDDLSSIFGAAPTMGGLEEVEGESEERRRARLERQQRTQERTVKALAEKNQRDLQTLREQEERHRFAETLDFEIKRWAAGKEGNLRALLSTLHYVLWPECGWQPVSLTDLIMGASVKKFYRKATLCIHPDKVQQKGATLQQKYIAEKIFDILKEAWNKFNSEELF